ncbi:hypothetical protein PybrP1_005023 [[Pythium] brassicae (nom. inval.)]|nr:hypothetical protein PybrP1_005023 [[Pythium] brassicae (nom. inval.)]
MAVPMSRSSSTPLLLALLALVLALAPPAAALHVIVGKGDVECLSVDAPSFKHGVSLNYEALRGVAGEMRAQLTDAKGGTLFEQTGPAGRFTAPVGDGAGLHTVCFHNVVDAVGDVLVGFSFHADDPSHAVLSNADAAKIKQVQDLEDLVYDLSVNLDTVKDTQAYMKAIKQYQLQVITSTHSRIMWWTCLEAAVLLALSVWQLAFLKRTLEIVSMSAALAALRARGMLAATTHQDAGAALDALLRTTTAPVGVYCGFDPTADSLHLGNLLQGIALRHFQRAGLRPILLVGGATGMIGDPSGKSEERVLLTDDVVARNASQLVAGLSPVLDFDCPRTGAVVVNNAEWHTAMSAVDWMRDIGRHFRVNAMLARDSVKKRMDSDQGISFLEFSYQLFQAYDFLHLHRTRNCVAQVGGSDQWGNIASGCELVRKTTGKDVFGVTLPLLTTASGEKYGKSAGNAVWLDANKTSAFDFYQYFLRSDDRDVEQLLKSFTFLVLDDIRALVHEHHKAPEKREAQKVLAATVTTTIHGAEGLEAALAATSVLFGKATGAPLSAEQVLRLAGDAPVLSAARADVVGQQLVDVCVRVGVVKSKAECRRLLKGGGLYVNNEKVEAEVVVAPDMLLDDTLLLLRTGRRNNFIVQVQ